MQSARMNFPIFFVFLFLNYQRLVSCAVTCYDEDSTKFNQRLLERTNNHRRVHSAQPLKLDYGLIKGATEWSRYLAEKGDDFEHSNSGGSYGENLYVKWAAGPYDDERWDPIKAWYDEVQFYDGKFSTDTGHFSQLVWKATRKVGCAVCTNEDKHYVTCRYYPRGNVFSEFKENVVMPEGSPEELTTKTTSRRPPEGSPEELTPRTTRRRPPEGSPEELTPRTTRRDPPEGSPEELTPRTTYRDRSIEETTPKATSGTESEETPEDTESPTPLIKTLVNVLIYSTAILSVFPVIILVVVLLYV